MSLMLLKAVITEKYTGGAKSAFPLAMVKSYRGNVGLVLKHVKVLVAQLCSTLWLHEHMYIILSLLLSKRQKRKMSEAVGSKVSETLVM